MNKAPKHIIFLILYTLAFICYAYFKLDFIVNYMVLFKSLMYVFLIIFYLRETKSRDYVYFAFIAVIMASDLFGIIAENISIPITLFFISNLVLIYLINNKAIIYDVQCKISKKVNNILLGLLSIYIVFIFFDKISFYITGLGMSLVVLLYVSYNYYVKTVKTSSFFMLAGVGSLIITYIFTGVNQLIVSYKYFSLIDATSYALALYFISLAVIHEGREFIENIEIIN